MSKSLGNVISPQEVIAKFGADILRLWVASVDYHTDIRLSDEILARTADAYRKIRNTLRFMLGNLHNFDPDVDSVDYADILEIDRWALSKNETLIKSVIDSYESYQFYRVNQLIHYFCTITMSSFYLDVLKDRLYASSAKSKERRSAQTVLYIILTDLNRCLAPVLSFTADETWKYRPGKKDETSVHLASWPEVREDWIDKSLEEKWEKLLALRDFTLKEIEKVREKGEIGDSLEAKVTFYYTEAKLPEFMESSLNELADVFLVSHVRFCNISKPDFSGMEMPGYEIKETDGNSIFLKAVVERAEGSKCARCWNYRSEVGKKEGYPDLCERCVSVIQHRR
jgi:isoleucyl-tRNA synthetase